MKNRSLSMLVCLCLLLTIVLCACEEDLSPTLITKAPGDIAVPTTTTTTTIATTTTDLFDTGDTDTTGTTATKPSIGDSEEVGSESGKAIAELAISLIGTPYKTGGNGPDGFDNPSFVVYCYKQNGYTVPRQASAMALYGEDVPPDELQVGDILVFANEIGGNPDFCGIYIGDEQFVSCNNPDSPTKSQKLDNSYWGPRFVAARRPAQ